jgi:hypothetical protein
LIALLSQFGEHFGNVHVKISIHDVCWVFNTFYLNFPAA